jgi:hypothetical protein
MLKGRNEKSTLYLLVFFNSLVALFLTTYAILSDFWVLILPNRHFDAFAINLKIEIEQLPELNLIPGCDRFKGLIHFGLLHGTSMLNYAYGCQVKHFDVSCI